MRPLRSLFSSLLLPQSQTTTLIRHSSSAADAGGSVSLYLRRARLIDSLRLLLRSHDPSLPFPLPSSPLLDSFVASQTLRSAPSPDSALSFFRSLSSLSFSSHPAVLHSLAKRLSLSRRLSDLHSLLDLDSLRAAPIDRLRWLSFAGDLPSSLRLWSSIRSAAAADRLHPPTESYNLIIALHASNSSHSAAVSTFSQMIADGAIPNSRTYTLLIDHLVQSENLDPAVEIFNLLPSLRIRRTSKQYDVLAAALSSSDRFEGLESLIKEMKSDGILPGRSMRDAIKKLRAEGFTESTEEFVEELSPDERIGFAADSDEETDDDDEGDRVRIRLKPWMDPIALARALDGWDRSEVADLESAGFVWTGRLVCKLLRSFKKPETAWEFFCWVAYQPGRFVHDSRTVSRMVAILARTGHVELVDRLLSKVQSERIQLPFATVRLLIDFYGLSKRPDAAIRIYRTAGSICGPLTQSSRVLLSSSLLRTMVKSKRKYEVMELLEEMMMDGVLLDLQTFSGLMQYFAEEGDLKGVHRLFGLVRQCGLKPDGYMCRVLIRAYCKNERAALGLKVFEEMRGMGLVLDRRTKGLLVKSLWKEGKLREAATVEERCEGVEEGMPAALPGHVWTVSEGDFKRVCDIYSGCFSEG